MQKDKMQKDKIKEMLANAETQKALTYLIEYSKGGEFSNEWILLSARYHDLRKKEMLGIIAYDDVHREHMRILNAILSLIDQIDDLEEALSQNKEIPLFEAKLIFIGSGNVGKTSLINTIIDGQYNPNETKTEGINIRDWKVRADNDIDVHIWDFGGQEIMHATHKFFMTQNSVYVVVVTPREEDRYGETELSYWLKLVQSFAPDFQ